LLSAARRERERERERKREIERERVSYDIKLGRSTFVSSYRNRNARAKMICLLCREKFPLESYRAHYEAAHADIVRSPTESRYLPFTRVLTFRDVANVYRLDLSDTDHLDLEEIFDNVRVALERCVRGFRPPVKAKALVVCRYSKASDDGEKTLVFDDNVRFSTKFSDLWMVSAVAEAVVAMRDKISQHITEYNIQGSGFYLESITSVDLTVITMGKV
jgi:hypothetical protein